MLTKQQAYRLAIEYRELKKNATTPEGKLRLEGFEIALRAFGKEARKVSEDHVQEA